MTDFSASQYCANHPGVETSLRCNRCNKLICPKCAVRTPIGYRCRECVRGQQKVFVNAVWVDYVAGFIVGAILSGLVSLLVILVSGIAGFFAWFVIAAVAPSAAAGIAEVLRFVTRRHRAGSLFITLLVSILLGALPVVIYQLLSMNLWGILFQAVYLVMAVPIIYYRLSGIQLFRR